MKLQVFCIWFAVVLQWGAVWMTWRAGRGNSRLHTELADTWRVLIECVKVMQRRDDASSRRLVGLVDELLRKYPPTRDTKAVQ